MAYPSNVLFKPTVPILGTQPIHETSASQVHALGTVLRASDLTYGEGEFIYLVGAASTAQGDLVCYDQKAGTTVRAVHAGSTSKGPAAVAMSANTAGRYGWYQISGSTPVLSGTVSSGGAVYLTAVASTVDDSALSGSLVSGAVFRSDDSGGYATVQLNRPSVIAEPLSASLATAEAAITTAEAAIATAEAAIADHETRITALEGPP